MPRRFVRRFTPLREWLRSHWSLRPFATWTPHPHVWSLQRRCVTGAFAAGLAICFVPLPLHVPIAVLVATVFLVNPLTILPVYYAAYRVGTAVLGVPREPFDFSLGWDWIAHGPGPRWKPWSWRYAVNRRYRHRRPAASG
jgi:hypothetical protein